MKKKLSMIIAMLVALTIGLTGCSQKGVDGSQTVAVLDETNVTLAEVNLLLRYQQAQMETYYSSIFGSGIFQQDLTGTGTIYGEMVKEDLMETFKQYYILEAEASNYDVELSEEEKAAITEAATAFVNANLDSKVKKALTLSQESVERVLSLMTIAEKMEDALTTDVDREVSDEEAAQKRVTYVSVSKSGTETDEEGNLIDLTEEELAQKETTARKLLDEARGGTDFSEAAEALGLQTSSITYGDADESIVLPDIVREAADVLQEGEYTEVIDTENAYYIVCMDSLFDVDATEARKDAIVQERKNALYTERYEELEANHTFEIKEDVLTKLTFDQTITVKLETE